MKHWLPNAAHWMDGHAVVIDRRTSRLPPMGIRKRRRRPPGICTNALSGLACSHCSKSKSSTNPPTVEQPSLKSRPLSPRPPLWTDRGTDHLACSCSKGQTFNCVVVGTETRCGERLARFPWLADRLCREMRPLHRFELFSFPCVSINIPFRALTLCPQPALCIIYNASTKDFELGAQRNR
jgi:hypothetical protein